MHELSIALSILDIAEREAENHKDAHVSAVHVRIGSLAGVVPDALRSAYDLAREQSTIPHARLVIEEVPATVDCRACKAECPMASPYERRCARCGTPATHIIHGNEFDVVALEIESHEDPAH